MRQLKQYFIYIMTNGTKPAVLYVGVTGDLRRRVWQHKHKLITGFTSRYNLTRLVYYERFFFPDAAINREKEIKGWRRSKKSKLIESANPLWEDLAREWESMYKPTPGAVARGDPHSTALAMLGRSGQALAPLEKTRRFGMTPFDREMLRV